MELQKVFLLKIAEGTINQAMSEFWTKSLLLRWPYVQWHYEASAKKLPLPLTSLN